MNEVFVRYAVRNILHSAILILCILLLGASVGWLFWGFTGLMWLSIFMGLTLFLGLKISPRLILKMYKAVPMKEYEASRLVHVVMRLSKKADLPFTPRLYYVPSRVANAFAVGSRKNGAIAITDGLLRAFNFRELQGVVAHEVGHLRNNDVWVMSLADSVTQLVNFVSWVGTILVFMNLPLFLFGGYQVPWLLIIILVSAPTVSALLQLALSRTREFEADLEAVALTRDPLGLVSGLEKLEQLSGGWFESVFLPGRRVPEPSLLRTHPSSEERIRRLLELYKEITSEEPPESHRLLSEFLPVVSK
jgi:heat shock protein HtpX